MYEFTLTSHDWASIRLKLKQTGVFHKKWRKIETNAIGGSSEYLVCYTKAGEYVIPSSLSGVDSMSMEPLYQLIRNLVPASIWAIIEKQKYDYENSYLNIFQKDLKQMCSNVASDYLLVKDN